MSGQALTLGDAFVIEPHLTVKRLRQATNGQVAEWLKAADCKSARVSVHRFESYPVHHPPCNRLQFSHFLPNNDPVSTSIDTKTATKIDCKLAGGHVKRVSGYRHLYRRGDKFVFRRGIPVRARAAFGGKHEVVVSLKTNDLSEARFRLLREQSQFDALLAKSDIAGTLIVGDELHRPTFQDVEASVRLFFVERMERTTTDKYVQPSRRAAALAVVENIEAFKLDSERSISLSGDGATMTTEWTAEDLITKYGWDIPVGSDLYHRLLRTIARAQIEASKQELQDLNGQPRRIEDHTFLPEQYLLDEERRKSLIQDAPIPIMDIFDTYAKEGQLKASTVRAWRRQITSFIDFLGHDDALRVEANDVFAWKDCLLNKKQANGKPLSARTVNDTYLAAIKATFNYAVETSKLVSNPAKPVRVRKKKSSVTRSRSLTDDEALIILRGTLQPMPQKLTAPRAFARRWVPWLCAYSGARVNEITQLRRQDIIQVDGIWSFLVTPDAGTVKTDKARLIPIHPHVIEQGFIDATDNKKGPLFYNTARRLGGSVENPQPKKVGEHIALWVRSLGVTDPEVQPNHGWRHRFKTIARRVGMDAEVRDVIQGHAPRTEGEAYGDTEISVLFNAVCLLPRYEWK